MNIPDEYVLVTVSNPGAPSFVSLELEYLGPENAAVQVRHKGISTPSKLLFKGTRELVLRNWEHTHANIWGFPYRLRAREACVRCEYYRLRSDYVRAVRFDFLDLCLFNENTENWEPLLAERCCGNKGIIADAEDGRIANTLLFIDRHFKHLFEVKGDMADPLKLDFSLFFNEVFADG